MSNNRCPNCGRFIEDEPHGYYAKPWPYSDDDGVLVYCDEQCFKRQDLKDRMKHIHGIKI